MLVLGYFNAITNRAKVNGTYPIHEKFKHKSKVAGIIVIRHPTIAIIVNFRVFIFSNFFRHLYEKNTPSDTKAKRELQS